MKGSIADFEVCPKCRTRMFSPVDNQCFGFAWLNEKGGQKSTAVSCHRTNDGIVTSQEEYMASAIWKGESDFKTQPLNIRKLVTDTP